jgi:hypothetical protein
MKKISLNIAVFVFKYLPKYLLTICLGVVYSYKSKYAYSILSKIPQRKFIDSNVAFVNKYHILTNVESVVYKVHLIDEERYEPVRTPDVYDVAKNNFVTLRKHEIAIYCFPNARIRARSDIIKIGQNVFWEKANRPEFAQVIPVDSDFISIDKIARDLISFEEKNIRHFDCGFNLCGVHTNTWAHFIISYLPKLIALDEFNPSSKLSLFVPSKMLENNKDLILFTIKNVIANTQLEIVYVDDDEVIECTKLYYCNSIGYLCDHTTYLHPASSCISIYGAKAVQKVSNRIWSTIKTARPRKLYIGRGAGRNLYNATEVEKYFIENGFEIVHPHLMTLEEKIITFGNASHICGPVASGFANMIFCKNKVKILGFFNFARCFDPFISGLSFAGGFNHEILFITGHEEVNNNINNSYLIELDKIISICKETQYMD